MASTIQTIEKPIRARAWDTSTSLQDIGSQLLGDPTLDTAVGGNTTGTYWTTGTSNDVTITGGKAVWADSSSAAATTRYIRDSITGPFNDSLTDAYRIEITISDYTDGNIYFKCGGFTSSTSVQLDGTPAQTMNATGTYSFLFSPGTGSGNVNIYGHTDADLSVSQIYAYKVESFGNNNHGQIYSGRALEFDGVTDRIDTGYVASTEGLTDTVTVACWVRKDDVSAASSWVWNFFYDNADGWGLKMYSSQIGIIEDIDGGDVALYGTVVTDNTWYRAVTVMDALEQKLYINGVLVGSGTSVVSTSGAGLESFTSTLYIGDRGGATAYHAGAISDVQVWDTAWSDADALFDYENPEQLALNNSGTSLTESNLKLWYPMNGGHRGQQSFVTDASNTGLGADIMTNGDMSLDANWVGNAGLDEGGTDAVLPIGTTGSAENIVYTKNKSREGSRSIYINVNQANEGVYNATATLVSGVTYKMSAWVYVIAGDAELLISNGRFAGSGYIDTVTTIGEWTELSIIATCNSAGSNNLQIRSASDSAEFYVDSATTKAVNDKNHGTTVFYGDNMWDGADNSVANWTANLGSAETSMGSTSGVNDFIKVVAGADSTASKIELKDDADLI